MKEEGLSPNQKLAYVINSLHLLPSLYQPDAVALKLYLNEVSLPAHLGIKIETFYSLTQPALHSLLWDDPHQQNKYPVALVIGARSDDQKQEPYYAGLKFVSWIQSGGTRCIGLKPTASQQQIERLIKLSHCAIFSNLGLPNKEERKFIQLFINSASKENHYPMMFVGSSCFYALQVLQKGKISQEKSQNFVGEFYIDHQSKLFKGLDLLVRAQFQNRKKMPSSSFKLLLQPELSYFRITSHLVSSKAKQAVACSLEHKSQDIYMLLVDPCEEQTAESIQLWHYPILNFIDLAKAHYKELDEKKVDKLLIAHGKIIFKRENGYYRLS